jgi:hypothetical protein
MAQTTNGGLPTLERKIHFYRVAAGVDEGGRPLAFDPTPALTAIERLPFADGRGGRYLPDAEGNAICVWREGASRLPSLRFCLIRRTGLPQLEEAGTVSDLNIATNAGLLEPVHVVVFPYNIVGADFNFYGPRLSRLGYYLHVQSGEAVPQVFFDPLLRQDVARELDHLTELRLFDLRVKTSYIETVRRADASLGDAFAANAHVLDDDVEELEVVMKPTKNGRHGALRRLLGPLKALARGPELRENTQRVQVRGKHDETGRVEMIDLLRDHIIANKQVLRLGRRSRAVEAGSAFEAIRAAHDELRDDLRRAAGILL